MRYAVSTDTRTALVDAVLNDLRRRGHSVTYYGPAAQGEETDWPDVTLQAARQVADHAADAAVVMCWTGTGAALVANKVPGVRAALCADAETARGARLWNDANVLALSLRATSEAVAHEILDRWCDTAPGDDDWNRRQLARVAEIEAAARRP